MWIAAYRTAQLTGVAIKNHKKFPKTASELWEEPADPALALAAAFGRPTD